MPESFWVELAGQGTMWLEMEEVMQLLRQDGARCRQLQAQLAAVAEVQREQHRALEERSAAVEERVWRIEERYIRLEQRVNQVEGALLRAVGSLMPKVDELLARQQNRALPAAVSDITGHPRQGVKRLASGAAAPGSTTTATAIDYPVTAAAHDVPGTAVTHDYTGTPAIRTCCCFINNPITADPLDLSGTDAASDYPATAAEYSATATTIDFSAIAAPSHSSTAATLSNSPAMLTSIGYSSIVVPLHPTVTTPSSITAATIREEIRAPCPFTSNPGLANAFDDAEDDDDFEELPPEFAADRLASYNLTPGTLHYAAAQGDVEELRSLLAARVYVDEPNTNGLTALYLAVDFNHIAAVRFLVLSGASTRYLNPLFLAIERGCRRTVEMLADKRNLEVREVSYGLTALSLAVIRGRWGVVEFLLQQGASVHTKDNNGDTPLHWAVKQRHSAVIRLLLRKGACSLADNHLGESPVYIAAKQGDACVIPDLLRVTETEWYMFNARNNTMMEALLARVDHVVFHLKRRSMLHLAATSGNLEMVEALLCARISPQKLDYSGVSALHFAAANGHTACLVALLLGGADGDAKDPWDGSTALHLAVREGHVDCVRVLLRECVSKHMMDKRRKTPLMVALELGRSECIALLVSSSNTMAWHNL